MSENTIGRTHEGQLALTCCGKALKLQILRTQAGYYIGTADEDGPVSRESAEYFSTEEQASDALSKGKWTQRNHP